MYTANNKVDVDTSAMLDLLAEGFTNKEVAEAFGISTDTVRARISELKKAENGLLAYEKVQHLDLLQVQQRLVAAVTDDKIAEAPLRDIASSFKVFKHAEQLITGRPTEIQGLMGFLLKIEKEDIEEAMSKNDTPSEGEDSTEDSIIEGVVIGANNGIS
jgi:transposase